MLIIAEKPYQYSQNVQKDEHFIFVGITTVMLMLTLELERTNIRQRQAEGIAAAKKRGVKFGRPPKPLPEGFHDAYQRWKKGDITGTAAAKECGMPLATFRYRAEIYENAKIL